MKFALLMLAALTGCATSSQMYLPDGSQAYNIRCDGSMNSIGNCYQKAGQLCGSRGYDLLNREGEVVPYGYEAGGFSADNNSADGAYITTAGAFVNRSLMVRCR